MFLFFILNWSNNLKNIKPHKCFLHWIRIIEFHTIPSQIDVFVGNIIHEICFNMQYILLFVLNQHPHIPNIRFLRISRAKSVPVLLQQPGKYIDFEALFPVQHGIFVHVISYNFSLCIIAPAYMWCFFIKMIHGQTIYVSRIVYITSCQSEWCCCKRCTDI